MREPLQHIGIGGSPPPEPDDESERAANGASGTDRAPSIELEPKESPADPESKPRTSGRRPERRTTQRPSGDAAEVEAGSPTHRRVRVTRFEERASTPRRSGLDRIKPRGEGRVASAGDDLAPAAERDPLGRAALYSSGPKRPEPALGTFLLECSACRRETPVTAGDLIRLGIPSLHLPFLRKFPSLMRCPACGRRTWLRIHWRI